MGEAADSSTSDPSNESMGVTTATTQGLQLRHPSDEAALVEGVEVVGTTAAAATKEEETTPGVTPGITITTTIKPFSECLDGDDAKNKVSSCSRPPLAPCTLESDLSRLDRKIWVVTTAALPWRTGTAVNPLLRALYLTRGRPPNAVTLVIPWLGGSRRDDSDGDIDSDKKEDEDEAANGAENDEHTKAQKKLYGQVFCNQKQQEEWIREYCRSRCNCAEEEKLLRIKFWKGTYHDSFGSIFPTEDICALIPDEEADVAILDEPEHLNWFRVPKPISLPAVGGKEEETEKSLGWAHKFNHVVGILHTNYGAYIKQYGFGTSLLTAPALNALSSLVVRAYCHRIIRLSATLPSFDPAKEVTSNVHGVRAEFFLQQQQQPKQEQEQQQSTMTTTTDNKAAPVYFIGKLIWAKGFDKVLELQQCYHATTGHYFAMDVYGGGNDERSIRRAFFGRGNSYRDRTTTSTNTTTAAATTTSRSQGDGERSSSEDSRDKRAANVFGQSESLREVLIHESTEEEASVEPTPTPTPAGANCDDNPTLPVTGNTTMTPTTICLPQETTEPQQPTEKPITAVSSSNGLKPKEEASSHVSSSAAVALKPLDIIGDLSSKTVTTGAETAEAGFQLIESVFQSMFGGRHNNNNNRDAQILMESDSSSSSGSSSGNLSDSEKDKEDPLQDDMDESSSANHASAIKIDAAAVTTTATNTTEGQDREETVQDQAREEKGGRVRKRDKLRKLVGSNTLGLVPPRARFKWRRTPLPARFLGVQDHIIVRDIPQQTIFLNMSTTEVLCTTTAEALAMGKFVIIPKHESNEFFYQFPNCLAYTDLDDCVTKLQYALSSKPEPLTDKYAHILAWEGATERLYEASRITLVEAEEYRKSGLAQADENAARFHVEGALNSHKLRTLINDKIQILGKTISM